jgi:hypothetical protein
VSDATPPAGVPLEAAIQVVRGDPTPDELAALVAVLTAMRGRAAPEGDPRPEPASRATWDRAEHDYHSPLAWVVERPGPATHS